MISSKLSFDSIFNSQTTSHYRIAFRLFQGAPTSIGPTLQQKSAPLVQWLPPRMGVPTAAVKFSSVEGGFFPLFCYVEAQNSDGENSMEVCFKQKTSQKLMLSFSFQTLAPATKFESNRKTLRNRFQQFDHFLLNNNGQTLPFVRLFKATWDV